MVNAESANLQYEHTYTPGMFETIPNPQSIAGSNRDEIVQIQR